MKLQRLSKCPVPLFDFIPDGSTLGLPLMPLSSAVAKGGTVYFPRELSGFAMVSKDRFEVMPAVPFASLGHGRWNTQVQNSTF